jgi:hypothetical protein
LEYFPFSRGDSGFVSTGTGLPASVGKQKKRPGRPLYAKESGLA